MKKAIIIISIIVMLGCVISISGSYAATTYAISANKIGYSDNSSLGADNVQAAVDGTCTKFSTKLDNIIGQIYPVGSIYISTSISDPKVVSSTIGVGTWEAYGKGKTLVGVNSSDTNFSTVNKTGGSKEKSLKVANLPSHSHAIPALTGTTSKDGEHQHGLYDSITSVRIGPSGAITSGATSVIGATLGITGYEGIITSTNGEHTHTVLTNASTTDSTGSGASFSTMDPYITVYMYKRIS